MGKVDYRDTAAQIFDQTARLADVGAQNLPDAAGSAFKIAAAIARAVAALLRALGIEDTHKAIEELVARQDAGKITDEVLAESDAEIQREITRMYTQDEIDALKSKK